MNLFVFGAFGKARYFELREDRITLKHL
ncbi:hypothetical protein FRACA_810012 [Frankia canadensis]|uniref:Uncharacterized protein n=1 Tax=Frankia canadensis TaxID=1836972 RepID=A0A2I2L1M9_9ACTN|nr:hypothetical protein FRACA_810012 [Frankia canadensis]SOU59111.1 hypothetical protein FRACA_810012 [Frankia canadensis]